MNYKIGKYNYYVQKIYLFKTLSVYQFQLIDLGYFLT